MSEIAKFEVTIYTGITRGQTHRSVPTFEMFWIIQSHVQFH